MRFVDLEATARFFPAEEAFLETLDLETFLVVLFAETALFILAEEDILFFMLFFELEREIFFPLTTRAGRFGFAFNETFFVLVKALPFPFFVLLLVVEAVSYSKSTSFETSRWRLLFLDLTILFNNWTV